MQREAIIYCSECRQPVISGKGFVRFSVPGKGMYQCSARRFNGGDCWKQRLKQRVEGLFGFTGSNTCVLG